MAVSKRTRFEVLRRDSYTCRYCRSTDNPLTVDHVTPLALGGTDKPDNLVAACRDCNAGKSSAAPDSSLVEEVREDALRHAEMIKQAYAVVVSRMGERDEYIGKFVDVFEGHSVPQNWHNSVGRWFEMGVPIELVVDAAQKAVDSPKRFPGTERFTYMCGIVWNQVHAVTETVDLKSAILGAFVTEEDQTALEEEAWGNGYDIGDQSGYRKGIAEYYCNERYGRYLCNVTEGTYPEARARHESWAAEWLAEIHATEPGAALLPPESAW